MISKLTTEKPDDNAGSSVILSTNTEQTTSIVTSLTPFNLFNSHFFKVTNDIKMSENTDEPPTDGSFQYEVVTSNNKQQQQLYAEDMTEVIIIRKCSTSLFRQRQRSIDLLLGGDGWWYPWDHWIYWRLRNQMCEHYLQQLHRAWEDAKRERGWCIFWEPGWSISETAGQVWQLEKWGSSHWQQISGDADSLSHSLHFVHQELNQNINKTITIPITNTSGNPLSCSSFPTVVFVEQKLLNAL